MKWSRIIKAIGAIVLLLAVGTFIIQAFPTLVGADYAFVVQSGSMEPAIQTGSVVFVEKYPPEQVKVGDIITFSKGRGAVTTTHRVIEKHQAGESLRFITQGDANEDPDADPVYRSEFVGKVMEPRLPLIGEVIFSIPLIGYVVAFGQTRMGWLVMVMIPTSLLIFSELWSLYKAGTMEPEEKQS